MQYPVGKTLVNEFSKAAQKRGYDQDLKQGYIEERKELYRKTAPINCVVVGGAALATAGAVGYKAIKGKSFKNAVGQQFAPFINSIKQFAGKQTEIAKNVVEAKTVSKYLKELGKSVANGFTSSFKVMLGVAKSVPKFAAIPAVALAGFAVAKSLLRNSEINAKYDTLQVIRNSQQ